MLAMISPAYEAFSESLSSLKFAHRAKRIKNSAEINEDLDQRALLRKYEAELRRLKKEVEEKDKIIKNQRKIYDSLEPSVCEEKKALEAKIKTIKSKVLVGGEKIPISETKEFISAIAEKKKELYDDYNVKLKQIERERKDIEEDKMHVERYKNLLLKQRDIMIALTERLNERDESISELEKRLAYYKNKYKNMINKHKDRVGILESTIRDYGFNVNHHNNQTSQINNHTNFQARSQFGSICEIPEHSLYENLIDNNSALKEKEKDEMVIEIGEIENVDKILDQMDQLDQINLAHCLALQLNELNELEDLNQVDISIRNPKTHPLADKENNVPSPPAKKEPASKVIAKLKKENQEHVKFIKEQGTPHFIFY